MRVTIVLAALVIAFLAMLGFHKTPVSDASRDRAVRASVESDTGSPKIAPTPSRTEQATSEAVPPQLVAIDEDSNAALPDDVEEEAVVTDPVEIAAIHKLARQMELRYLESSPAKDTPEAKQIEAMLAVRGISRAAVPTCYNVAWNYHHMLKLTGSHEDAMSWIASDKGRLRPFGTVDEGFWQQIVAIKPTVFFGQGDYSAPRNGETLPNE